jgi:hypothetical protein
VKQIQLGFMSTVLQILGLFLGKFILKRPDDELEEMAIDYLKRILALTQIMEEEGNKLNNDLIN